MYDPWNLGG